MKWCQSGYALINLGFKKVFAPSLSIPRLYYRKIVSKTGGTIATKAVNCHNCFLLNVPPRVRLGYPPGSGVGVID
jgi:hypothetical protein